MYEIPKPYANFITLTLGAEATYLERSKGFCSHLALFSLSQKKVASLVSCFQCRFPFSPLFLFFFCLFFLGPLSSFLSLSLYSDRKQLKQFNFSSSSPSPNIRGDEKSAPLSSLLIPPCAVNGQQFYVFLKQVMHNDLGLDLDDDFDHLVDQYRDLDHDHDLQEDHRDDGYVKVGKSYGRWIDLRAADKDSLAYDNALNYRFTCSYKRL